MPAKIIAPSRGNPGPRLNMVTVYSVSVGHNREPYKTVEPIEVPFGMWTRVGPCKEPCINLVTIPQGTVDILKLIR